jgi:hypothetical protein
MSWYPKPEHKSFRSGCPVDQLEWFVNRTLPAKERTAIEAHLAGCPACRLEVAVWIELRQAMREVSAQTPRPRADMFAQIDRRLDALPVTTLWPRRRSPLQALRLTLAVCGEHFRIQARLIRRDLFLMPLLLIPLAGWIVYLSRSEQQVPETAALLAALLTAFGKAFLYGQEVDPAREMVLATPTSPRLVLGTRCCLVLGYDLLLNCGLILPFLAWQGIVTPGWFLNNWLAPVWCLSAITLLLSILVNSGTAVFICVVLWILRLPATTQLLQSRSWQQQYEGFWHQGPLLFVVALLVVLLALSTLERKERFA